MAAAGRYMWRLSSPNSLLREGSHTEGCPELYPIRFSISPRTGISQPSGQHVPVFDQPHPK